MRSALLALLFYSECRAVSTSIADASALLERVLPRAQYSERLMVGRRSQLGDEMVYRPGMIGSSSVDDALTYGEFDLALFAQLVDRAIEPNAGSLSTTFVDVGSGVGRLVLAAACLWPDRFARFTGVEKVAALHDLALAASARAQLAQPCDFYCADAADVLAADGALADADVLFAYSSAFASEGDMLSDFSAMCGNCLRVGSRVITTDRRLLSVDGLWKFELVDSIEGPNAETGGVSTGYVHLVTQSKRA